MKKRSPQTELRETKRLLNAMRTDLLKTADQLRAYRTRATQAEQEVAEWKLRFDALLKIVKPEDAQGGTST